MQHLFIINRHAGKNNSWKAITDRLEKLKIENLTVKFTSSRGNATEIVRDFVGSTDDFVRVYACGGDGTVNEVIRGAYGLSNCAVAPVPIGSGNDFIRSFELPKESFLDIENLVNREEVEVDLLKCGDYLSDNSISVGFDCAVAKNVDKFKKWKFITSSFAYKISIFYCLLNGRKHNFKIKVDGEELKNDSTYLLSISAKGKYYGGGIKCSPNADNGDGLIDFLSVPTLGVLKFVSLLPTFIRGEHIDNPKMDFILHKKCREVEYISDEPFDIGIDGEIISTTYAKITVLPKAVKIILPVKN